MRRIALALCIAAAALPTLTCVQKKVRILNGMEWLNIIPGDSLPYKWTLGYIGEAYNQSDKTVRNVTVHADLRGRGHRWTPDSLVGDGTLEPGETRAFRVVAGEWVPDFTTPEPGETRCTATLTWD